MPTDARTVVALQPLDADAGDVALNVIDGGSHT